MRPPCTVDDLLGDARVRTDAGPLTGGEADSLRRVEEDFAAAVRHGTAGGGYPRPALGSVYPVPGYDRAEPPPGGSPRREKAAHDLRTLSAWAVRTPRAAHHLAGLASTHQMEPDGAMVFGCLLHLADRDDQAEFLWQFAAGAGKAASAECLHLLHTTRGDLRQARHWAGQAADLDNGEGEAPPRVREAGPLTSPLLLRTWRALRRREVAASLTADAFHTRAGTLPPTVTTAVQRLVPASAPFPTPLWPDASLAERLRESTQD
jgi:hypothetical protein